ncbi:helix-turn-helix domain-containing protein [Leifsonia sp. NPDC058292]|uniref:helix-turn-helix domain-containing protein n=1 Tax=Leifsonia sp. NPDC058292 TaxID=3346428 RepID=UPI0036DCDB43
MYAEVPAPAEVRDAVACLWTRTAEPGDPATLVLPDGCFDLIWTPGNPLMLAAPDTVASHVPAGTADAWVGLRFRPGVGKAVLGVPMEALLNERPTVADVLAERPRSAETRASGDLIAQLSQAGTPAEAAQTLTSLGGLLNRAAPIDRRALHATRLLADPQRTVASVAAEVDLPQRTLNRRMTEQVGYGPKMLQRVLRLQRFLALAEGTGADRGIRLGELAATAGYADQPHLVRDAAALTGLTPTALLAARGSTP